MEHVMVVHGDDGLDEISISGPTQISEYKNYKIEEYTISPQEFGITTSPFEEISGSIFRRTISSSRYDCIKCWCWFVYRKKSRFYLRWSGISIYTNE
jgi:hypothetical protein